jgi:rare lipoprotein A
MQKLTLVVAALFLASTTATHAELVQSLPLSSYTDNNSLANQLLERDSATAPLFQSTKTNKPAAPVRSAKTDTPTTVSVNVLDTPDVSKVDVADDRAEPDLIDRMSTLASQTVRKFSQNGMASWYGRQFHGNKTASGERFDMNAMTAAHRSLPLACYIRVTNRDNGKSVIVKVNDRGPFHGKRILDLSYAAAKQIGITQRGTGNVIIERVDNPISE